MRIAIAEIGQETDTFSPLPTTLELFESYGIYRGRQLLDMVRGVGMLGGFLDIAEDEPGDYEIVPVFRAWAGAGGRITRETHDALESQLIEGLEKAGAIDAFFFAQHGAAATERDDDLEGSLLQAVRHILDTDIPIVCPLDHHANITRRMIQHANLMVGHRTQPHDLYDTGQAAARLFFQMLSCDIQPTVGLCKVPMITQQDQFLTAAGPMKRLFDRAREMEADPQVLSASPFPMQPWLDVAEGGWGMLVYTDGDAALARDLAEELGDLAWSMRDEFWVNERVAIDAAAAQADRPGEGLVVLSDTGDSVYGGAPGDTTGILAELIHQEVSQVALVPVFDPEAQEAARLAGIGAEVTLKVGGKIDTAFSGPVEVHGTVAALSEGLQVKLQARGYSDIGPTALIECGNVKIVLMSRRGFAVNQPILYTHLGVSIEDARMVVVKTASNFQFFDTWRTEVIRVDTPGTTQSDLRRFTWERLPRPVHPLDDLTDWSAASGSG